ncbi:hypothetical protein D3C83_73520 [compost metagenome]
MQFTRISRPPSNPAARSTPLAMLSTLSPSSSMPWALWPALVRKPASAARSVFKARSSVSSRMSAVVVSRFRFRISSVRFFD